MAIGSCFASHIGSRLERLKFNLLMQPSGIVFNPASIHQSIQQLLEKYTFSEHDLFEHQGLWHSYWHHSVFSGIDKQQVLNNIQQEAAVAQAFLAKTNRLILTFGTAYAYHHLAQDIIVANCHKLPANVFLKKRLAIEEIIHLYISLFQILKNRNPDIKIILSVSPIRHTKDGIVENQRSKAILLLATEALCQHFDFVHYFPAYEYLMDDLRDYRFYSDDLVHPSDMAIEYIWQQFQTAFFDTATQTFNQQIEKIKKALAHRPLHPQSAAYQAFQQKQLTAIADLKVKYPNMSWAEEEAMVR
jgi:hypothetical protein